MALTKVVLQQVSKLRHPTAVSISSATILMIDRVAATVGGIVVAVAMEIWRTNSSVLIAVAVTTRRVTEAVALVLWTKVQVVGVFLTGDVVSSPTSLNLIVQL